MAHIDNADVGQEKGEGHNGCFVEEDVYATHNVSKSDISDFLTELIKAGNFASLFVSDASA